VLCSPSWAFGALNDVFPADYVSMPAGKTVLTTYVYERHSSGPYAGGKQTSPWSLDASFGVFRLSRFFDLAGLRSAATVVTTYANQQLDGAGIPGYVNKSASGWYDIRLSGTVWVINQPEARHYLGLNVTFLAPTGSYQTNKLQNIGENRWRTASSIGWIRGIGNRWTAEAIGELAWYGSNDAYFPGQQTRQQSPTAALTSYLRYRWDNGLQTYAGYQWNNGGETQVAGVSQNDIARSQRASVGLIYPVTPGHVFNLRIAKDVQLENGFKTDREVAARWLVYF
jgi:hypothetical protein